MEHTLFNGSNDIALNLYEYIVFSLLCFIYHFFLNNRTTKHILEKLEIL